jgi:hypothetical protein
MHFSFAISYNSRELNISLGFKGSLFLLVSILSFSYLFFKSYLYIIIKAIELKIYTLSILPQMMIIDILE